MASFTPSDYDKYRKICRQAHIYMDCSNLNDLQKAVLSNDPGRLSAFLHGGHGVNWCDESGQSLLILACSLGHKHCVKVLLQQPHCNVNYATKDGKTALMESIYKRNMDVIDLLINDVRCDINFQKNNGYSALHLSISTKNNDAVAKILSRPDCNVNLKSNHNGTPLFLAVDKADLNIVYLLLNDERCDVNQRPEGNETALHKSSFKLQPFNMDIVNALVNHQKCDVNALTSFGDTFPHLLIDRGRVAIGDILKNSRVDISIQNCHGDTAFHKLVDRITDSLQIEEDEFSALRHFMDHKDISKILTRRNYKGHTPLSILLNSDLMTCMFKEMQYDSKVLKLLKPFLKQTNHLNCPKYTLAMAVELCPFAVCEILMAHGADANSSYRENETALHCAIRQNSFKKCQLLKLNGACLQKKWREMNALQFAISISAKPAILELLADGIPMETLACYLAEHCFVGETSLTCAVRLGVMSWAKHLIKEKPPRWIKFICGSKGPVLLQTDETNYNALQVACKDRTLLESVTHRLDIAQYQREIEQMTSWYSQSRMYSTIMQPENQHDNSIQNTDTLHFLDCQKFPELFLLKKRICSVLDAVCEGIRRNPLTKYLAFKYIVAGSFAEGTVTSIPDNFDVICEMLESNIYLSTVSYVEVHTWNLEWTHMFSSNNVIGARNFFKYFSLAIENEVSGLVTSKSFKPLFLHSKPVVMHKRHLSIQILWRGKVFKDLIMHLKLIPAFAFPGSDVIPKASRRIHRISDDHFFVTYFRSEVKRIKNLPMNIKEGYMLAKLLRSADVSRPDDVTTLCIEETIDVKRLISSYKLKLCLFHILATPHIAVIRGDKFTVADHIYEMLERLICKGKEDSKAYKISYIRGCWHDGPDNFKICAYCFKNDAIRIISRNIRKWIQDNRLLL